jgi:hypothetical protein
VKSILMKYKVVSRSTFTSKQLQSQLKAAVQDGTFDANLQTAATNNGATNLQGATSNSVTTQTITEGNTPSPRANSTGLSGGAIAGVIIGIFVALLLMAWVVYFFMHVSASNSKGGATSTPDCEQGVRMA